jgi:hypothetical protein
MPRPIHAPPDHPQAEEHGGATQPQFEIILESDGRLFAGAQTKNATGENGGCIDEGAEHRGNDTARAGRLKPKVDVCGRHGGARPHLRAVHSEVLSASELPRITVGAWTNPQNPYDAQWAIFKTPKKFVTPIQTHHAGQILHY